MLSPSLPIARPDRGALAGFSVATGLLAGAATWLVLEALSGPRPLVSAGGAALLVTGVGAAGGRFVVQLYGAWDRVARKWARLAGRTVSWIAFHAVVLPGRSSGERLGLEPPEGRETGWKRRPRPGRPRASAGHSTRRDSWLRGYLSWVRSGGGISGLMLLPYLVLLRNLDSGEPPEPVGRDIYTLY